MALGMWCQRCQHRAAHDQKEVCANLYLDARDEGWKEQESGTKETVEVLE